MDKPIIKSVIQSSVMPGITMIATSGSIYYTLDGSEPSASSLLYTQTIDYPINTTIKAIAISDTEQSEVAEYICTVPLYRHNWTSINGQKNLVVKKDLDLLSYYETLNNEIVDLEFGKLRNIGQFMHINSFILPFGFDFDEKFPNCPVTFDRLNWQKRGQILQQNGWLKMFDGSKWHDFQQIYSGSFANKPTVEQGIPIGFAYFCTDKQTTEGATNGIMIYHKGNNVWVDALGRVVQ